MKFIKNNPNIVISTAIILAGIVIASVIFSVYSPTVNPEKDNNKQRKAYEEFPLLRELNISADFKGTASSLKDGWSRYENKSLGFSVEYPSIKIPRESSYPLFGEFYAVDLSEGDFEFITVSVEPSRSHTIDEWLKDSSDYSINTPSFVRRTISGYDAVVVTPIHEPPVMGNQMQRAVVVIKDDILYTIVTRDIPSAEYERIWKSFRFLE